MQEKQSLVINMEKLKTLHWQKTCGGITSMGSIRNVIGMFC